MGIFVLNVYASSRQFACKDDFREAIVASWDRIDLKTLVMLADSMPDRFISAVENKEALRTTETPDL